MDTKAVFAGNVQIGGGAPVTVQSMTNTDTRDAAATIAQIRALTDAGAEIVRVSVYDEICARNVRALVDESPVPLVADIHFDHRLAIEAVENGIAKRRINPGNIGGEKKVRLLADCLKAHHIPCLLYTSRRDANEQIKKMKKDSVITEDEAKTAETELQKATDNAVKEADRLSAEKEKEIMAV